MEITSVPVDIVTLGRHSLGNGVCVDATEHGGGGVASRHCRVQPGWRGPWLRSSKCGQVISPVGSMGRLVGAVNNKEH